MPELQPQSKKMQAYCMSPVALSHDIRLNLQALAHLHARGVVHSDVKPVRQAYIIEWHGMAAVVPSSSC